MRLGIFGGSFDPIHNGHLALAHACRVQGGLDRVLLVPAAQQPLKPDGPRASAADRLAMVRLAVAGADGLEASDIELNRGGVSYTVDTLHELSTAFPATELFLLVGADTLHDLPQWREPAAILQLATPLAVHRPGEPPVDFSVLAGIAPPALLTRAGELTIAMPALDISSSQIRARVGRGESIDDLVPTAVATYIAAHSLYC